MKFFSRRKLSTLLLTTGFSLSHPPASAATFATDEDNFINIGNAFRISYSSIEDAAPNGKDRSNDFTVEEARLYTYGKIDKNVSFELNLARNSVDNKFEVLDAHVGLELNNYFNVWVGRLLPPASRASAEAPAYPPTFDYPITEQAPTRFGGRDDGATLWGNNESQKFKYQFGLFKGRDGLSNQADELSYATRLSYNFWDAEPGFYNLASYDGSKSILALGASYKTQKDGAGTQANPGDYQYWNIDGRLEKPLSSGGVIGFETSYYDYDNDKTNDLIAPAGNGYFFLASYTFPQIIGIGKIQPKFDIQNFDNESSGIETRRYELGVSYLISGSSNTRIDTFVFKEERDHGLPSGNGFKIIYHLAHFF